jgi:hypothetical protein
MVFSVVLRLFVTHCNLPPSAPDNESARCVMVLRGDEDSVMKRVTHLRVRFDYEYVDLNATVQWLDFLLRILRFLSSDTTAVHFFHFPPGK